jgi:hypothetical protein
VFLFLSCHRSLWSLPPQNESGGSSQSTR